MSSNNMLAAMFESVFYQEAPSAQAQRHARNLCVVVRIAMLALLAAVYGFGIGYLVALPGDWPKLALVAVGVTLVPALVGGVWLMPELLAENELHRRMKAARKQDASVS